MLKCQLKRLLGSRSFLLMFFSLCTITLLPTVFLLADLLGAPQISLSPAWYYFGDLGSLVGNPLRIVKSLYLMFLVPLSCSIPYAASFYDDMADGAYLSLYARGGKYKYWGEGILLTFGSAFFLFLVPMLLSQLLLCIAVPLDSLKLFPSYPLGEEPGVYNLSMWRGLFIRHPYLYFLAYAVIPALYGGLLSVASYGLSLLFRKRRLFIVFTPGLCAIIFDFLLSYLGHMDMTAFELMKPSFYSGRSEGGNVWLLLLCLLLLDLLLLGIGFLKNRDILPAQ